MRYWILVVLLNGLFALVMHFAAPEMFGSTEHYVGAGICALIAIVITGEILRGCWTTRSCFSLSGELWLQVWRFFFWGIGYSWNSGES